MIGARADTGVPGPSSRSATRGRVGPAAILPLVLLSAGCAGLFGSVETGPGGLSDYDHDLRALLTRQRFDSAMARVAPDRSKAGDELLRLQNLVAVAHYAGRPTEGADALEAAVTLAEDRYTRSVSRAVLSALTNDRILPYRPPPTERLLLHYYGALVHFRMGGPEAAAVEARRLEGRLQAAEDEAEPTGARRDLHVALHRFAAALFEAAGERNAAGVARRRAGRLEGEHVAPEDSVERADGETGEVVLAVEQGFVAHRVERSINVLVWPEEMRQLASAGDSADEEVRYATAVSVARRALGVGGGDASPGEDASGPRRYARARPGRRSLRDLEGSPRLLRVAWPEYRSLSRPEPVRVLAAGQEEPKRRWSVDLSAAVVEEFGERAPEVLAKALLRAVAKNVVAGEVEEEVEEEDEALGELTGVALNVLGALTERADTRSWNLLPGRLVLVRLRLPAGTHRLEVVTGPASAGAGGPARAVDAEATDGGGGPAGTVEVEVPAGGVAVTSVRLWR